MLCDWCTRNNYIQCCVPDMCPNADGDGNPAKYEHEEEPDVS